MPNDKPPQEKPSPGIAEVDPVPLSQTAGEGIDPDANEAAHEDLVEQREKLRAARKLTERKD